MLVILALMPLIKSQSPHGVQMAVWYGALLLLSLVTGLVVYGVYSEPMNEQLRCLATPRAFGRREANL